MGMGALVESSDGSTAVAKTPKTSPTSSEVIPGDQPNSVLAVALAAKRQVRSQRHVIFREVYEARLEALRIRSAANQEALRIKRSAAVESERLQERAIAQGHAQGIERAHALFLRASALSNQRLASIEGSALELALAISAKLVGKVLDREAGALVALCAEVTLPVREASRITLRVHPRDFEALTREKSQLLARLDRSLPLSVVADTSLSRGDCIVESSLGTLDGRLEVRLNLLRSALAAAKTGDEGG